MSANTTNTDTPYSLESSPDASLEIRKDYEMALASDEARTAAAHEKAIGKVLIDALRDDVNPTEFEEQPIKTMQTGLARQVTGMRYDEVVKSYAIHQARERTIGARQPVPTLEEFTSSSDNKRYRTQIVAAAQETIANRNALQVQAEEAEQAAVENYELEQQRDPARLASAGGRDEVAQELLQKL